MHTLTEDKSNNHPNDDMPPQSGPRYTARTPTPAQAIRWGQLATANLLALSELVIKHDQLSQCVQTLKTDEPASPACFEFYLRAQLQAIAEGLSEARELARELGDYAAANFGGVVVLPAED